MLNTVFLSFAKISFTIIFIVSENSSGPEFISHKKICPFYFVAASSIQWNSVEINTRSLDSWLMIVYSIEGKKLYSIENNFEIYILIGTIWYQSWAVRFFFPILEIVLWLFLEPETDLTDARTWYVSKNYFDLLSLINRQVTALLHRCTTSLNQILARKYTIWETRF